MLTIVLCCNPLPLVAIVCCNNTSLKFLIEHRTTFCSSLISCCYLTVFLNKVMLFSRKSFCSYNDLKASSDLFFQRSTEPHQHLDPVGLSFRHRKPDPSCLSGWSLSPHRSLRKLELLVGCLRIWWWQKLPIIGSCFRMDVSSNPRGLLAFLFEISTAWWQWGAAVLN